MSNVFDAYIDANKGTKVFEDGTLEEQLEFCKTFLNKYTPPIDKPPSGDWWVPAGFKRSLNLNDVVYVHGRWHMDQIQAQNIPKEVFYNIAIDHLQSFLVKNVAPYVISNWSQNMEKDVYDIQFSLPTFPLKGDDTNYNQVIENISKRHLNR